MKVSTLTAYVDHNNIFRKTPLSLQNAKDRQSIANSIDNDLSPENLTCDGELPRHQVKARYDQLTKAAFELKQLDPSVKFYEYGTEV